MNDISLKQPEPYIWQLSGSFTMSSISDAYQQLNAKRPTTDKWVIDCKSVTKVDSAGVAFLLNCMRYARYNKIKLKLENLPKNLTKLITAQGIVQLVDNLS